jgi:hypothetical protein
VITVNWTPGRRQLRWFGVAALFGFGLIGFVVLRWTGSMTAARVLWAVGLVSFLVGLPFPNALRPLWVALTVVTFPIGWLLSQIFLRLIFYGLLAPIGLLFRLSGRDPLRLRRPAGDTYWRARGPAPGPTSYFRQS